MLRQSQPGAFFVIETAIVTNNNFTNSTTKFTEVKAVEKKKVWVVTGIVLILFLMSGLILESYSDSKAAAAQKKVGTVSSNDVYVLSKIINGEARGETYVGQVAVGAVIVNRVKNSNFPNSVYGVVFEPGAFDAVSDGQYYSPPSASAVKAARAAINGWDPSGGALYYWNPATATSRWIWSRRIIARIGRHVFGR